MAYRNLDRIKREEEELEELEREFAKEQAKLRGEVVEDEQPEAIEENEVVVKAKELDSEEEKTWKERYSNLKSFADKRYNETIAKLNELENKVKLAEKKPTDMPTNPEEAKQWVAKYPELASVLKTLWKEDIDYLKEEIGPQLTELEELKAENTRVRAYNLVVRAHPDFPELINNQEFIDWVNRQPEEKGTIGQAIFDALNGVDADAAIKAVNIYKKESAPAAPVKDTAREAAKTVKKSNPTNPNSDGKREFSESMVEEMSIWEYEKYESEIDDAKREGRFIYDLSGAAR